MQVQIGNKKFKMVLINDTFTHGAGKELLINQAGFNKPAYSCFVYDANLGQGESIVEFSYNVVNYPNAPECFVYYNTLGISRQVTIAVLYEE